MKLYIEHMISPRCKVIVEEALNRIDIQEPAVSMGLAEFTGDITEQQYDQLRVDLLQSGLVLITNTRSILINKIKSVIIEMITCDSPPKQKYSTYISERINYNYTYLANTFSEMKGMTIQHFIINYKIEKAKELLMFNQLTISEISYKLNYSSVAHLSNQFKKVTGLSPSFYRKQGANLSELQLNN